MRFIAHRALLDGPALGGFTNPENAPSSVLKAISMGFDVEIDLRVCNKILFLGHDTPTYSIDLSFLNDYKNKLWVHAKNLETFNFLYKKTKDLNYFSHDQDDLAITSKGYIWLHPRCNIALPITLENLVVLRFDYNSSFLDKAKGVAGLCTDYPIRYSATS